MAQQSTLGLDNDQIAATAKGATIEVYGVLREDYIRRVVAVTTAVAVTLPPDVSLDVIKLLFAPPVTTSASIPPVPAPAPASTPSLPTVVPPPLAVDTAHSLASDLPLARMSTRSTPTNRNEFPTSPLTTKQRAALKKLSGMSIDTPTQVLVDAISKLLTPPISLADSSNKSGSNFPT